MKVRPTGLTNSGRSRLTFGCIWTMSDEPASSCRRRLYSEDCQTDSRPGHGGAECVQAGFQRAPVHAGGFFFGFCPTRRPADGVAFVPTFFGAFDAARRAKRAAVAARSVFEDE